MKIMSVSEAKMKLSHLVDVVQHQDETITITKNGRPAAILLSPEEYESWSETRAIMSDTELLSEIKKNKKAYEKGQYKTYSLQELFEDLKD